MTKMHYSYTFKTSLQAEVGILRLKP